MPDLTVIDTDILIDRLGRVEKHRSRWEERDDVDMDTLTVSVWLSRYQHHGALDGICQ